MRKFNFQDISPLTGPINSSRSSSNLISESYTGYLNKIEKHFVDFKINHYVKQNEKYVARKATSSRCDTLDISHTSSTKINSSIPAEYFETDYKVNGQLLESDTEVLENTMLDLIEKCGKVERELENKLTHSSSIYGYINSNLPMLGSVDDFLMKLREMKQNNQCLKEKFMVNANSLIGKGIKKRNSQKVMDVLAYIKKISNMVQLLRELFENNPSAQEFKELLVEANTICETIRTTDYLSKITICKAFELDIDNYNKSAGEHLINNLTLTCQYLFSNFILFKGQESFENNISNEQYKINVRFS